MKTEAEIRELFRLYLHGNEELYWVGKPIKNRLRLNYRHLVGFALSIVGNAIIYLFFAGWMLFAWFIITTIVIGTLALVGRITGLVFDVVMVGSLVGLMATAILSKNAYDDHKKEILNNPPVVQEQRKKRLLERNYYSISNQRIMISERDEIHDYSLLLVADAAVGKPKNSASTIYIYNKTNPTGQLPEPVFELKGLPEDEAQKAYEILRQAREEALEDRAREMGIE